VWGDEPNGEDDMVVVRVADFDRAKGLAALGDSPTVRAIPESARNRRVLRPGDLLIEKSGGGEQQPVGNVVLFTDDRPAVCSNFVARMPVTADCDSRFVGYVFRALYAEGRNVPHIKQTSGIQNLDSESYLNEMAWLPARSEQEHIANFLDEQAVRIDALIAEKERLHVTLEEWQSAELTRVCFGTDLPQVRTRNPWVPSLPAGWRLMRLKHLVQHIEQGWSPECEARLAEEDEWGVLKAGASNGGVFREQEHKALPLHLEPVPSLEVKVGDVLVTRASGSADLVGSFAFVYATRPKLMLSDKNFRLKFGPDPDLLPELLAWSCNTRPLREQVGKYVSGSEGLAKNIGSGSLRELWLPVPPRALQPILLKELDTRRSELFSVSKHLGEHIARLREYRSSLISAAVTGQLDLSTFKAAA
jgi:type I restriction enzyme S subunit